MAAIRLCVVGILIFLGGDVSGFLFDNQPSTCNTIYSDFKGGLLNDGSSVDKPIFFRSDPILIREIAIDIVHCPDYANLYHGNFSIMYMDAADIVLKQQFKTLSSNPTVSVHTNSLIPNYNLRIQFDGSPRLSRSLKIDSNIPGTCTPPIIVTGCEPEASLCQNACLHGGQCVGINTCECPAGRAGERCENAFTTPEIYNISVGVVSGSGSIVTSDDGGFQFELFNEMAYVDDGTTKRDARDSSRRHGPDHHHHGHFHVHGHGGYAHCSHHGHDCNEIFSHDPHGAFTTHCHMDYGHDHHGHTHLYSTNHHDHNHHQPHQGASLVHTPHQLTMTVNNGHTQCHLSVPHGMRPDHHHEIVSSFSPYHGCSLYVDGHHVGSHAPGPLPHSPYQPVSPQPFCMGNCAYNNNAGPAFNASLSNLMFTSGSLQNMVTNGIASILGGALGSLFQTHRPQPPASTTPVTTRPTTSSGPVVTLNHHTTPAVTTTTTPMTTTTTQMSTTSAFGLQSSPICYDCGPMSTDGQCQNVKMCSGGEICVVFEDHGQYSHRCLERNTCFSAKSSVGATGCWQCCTGYLCNERCPAPCSDEPLCATVKSTGYKVCNDAAFAKKNCRSTCNLCSQSG